jgi:uncharacterized protein with LGFP repeats
VRRTLAGSIAFLAMTGTFVVLPVYASPVPEAEPVPTATEAIAMGSVGDPAPQADVQAGTTEPVVGVPDTEPTLVVSETDVSEFSLVGVTWAHDPAVTGTVVQVRVRDTSGTWGEWTAVEVEDAGQDEATDSGTTRRGGTEPLWTGPSTGIEAELVTRTGAQPTDVTLDLVAPGSTAADQALESPDITDTANAAGAMPPVYSRAQWGADESIRTWDPEYPSTLKAATVHHTAGSNDYTQDEVPAILRAIYTYHTVTRGWGDIGYNVVVDRYGRLWEGRYGGLASTVIGGHAGGFNTYTFGVSMLGDYDKAPTTSAMIDAVAEIIAWKFSLYRIDPVGTTTLVSAGSNKYPAGTSVSLPTIFGHRDVTKTSCPGVYGYAKMGTVQDLVAAKLPAYSNPHGSLDSVAGGLLTASVAGWAVDPNVSTESLQVHVYVDGKPVTGLTAGGNRPDVAAAFPWAGANHGFRATFAAAAGSRRVCAYGINQGAGVNTLLGCRTAVVRAPDPTPKGSLDSVTVFGSQFSVKGWALDEDKATEAVGVHVYVDGRAVGSMAADRWRPDVDRAMPGVGRNHGFSAAFPATSGSHSVCAYAVNVGAGSTNPLLGCRTITVDSAAHSPVGALSSASVHGRVVTTRGWVVDPQAPTSASSVHVYVSGKGATSVVAGSITTATAPYAVFGVDDAHGYTLPLTLPAGSYDICAYGINTGAGANVLLGCRSATVQAAAWNPEGSLDAATVLDWRAAVGGWSVDFDAPTDPVSVHLYLDGRAVTGVRADRERPDVGRVFSGVGDYHGYYSTVTVPAGAHELCAYAINVGQGTGNPRLGCKTVTVKESAYNPVGSLDEIAISGGTATIRGWTFDPDVLTSPIDVHVYVDGVGRALLRADQSRPDVGAAYPGTGSYHGFQTDLSLSTGEHTICAYAINVDTGTANSTLGCRTVTI